MSLTAELDRVESEARDRHSSTPLLSAALHAGFGGWADVVRHARGGNPLALELLCRRVERGL